MKRLLFLLAALVLTLGLVAQKELRKPINAEKTSTDFKLASQVNEVTRTVKVVNSKAYEVVKGERPVINYQQVPSDSYEPLVLQIKLKAEKSNELPFQILKLSGKGFVETGIKSLDKVNQEIGAVQFKPMLWALYQIDSKSLEYKDRHKAWGFHLWYQVTVDTKTDIIAAIEKYQALDEIEIAEPIFKKRLIGTVEPKENKSSETKTKGEGESKWTANDTRYDEQWHYHNTGQQGGTADCDIDLPEAWDIEKGSSDVIVAVIDGGVQFDHPDLEDNMWPTIGPDGTGTPVDEHGTHVAGTIAAVTNNNTGVAGIAGGDGTNPGVQIMSIELFEANHGLSTLGMFTYAADNGAAISQNSWGYENADTYVQSDISGIDYFNANGGGSLLDGGLTVFAAGNDDDNGNWWPGYYTGALSVAATNNKDVRSYYSNYGSWVDISAPGGEQYVGDLLKGVLSTVSSDGYDFMQGTSMACPHVSGVAALLVSYADRNGLMLTNSELWDLLVDNVDDHYAMNSGYIGELGSGRLNANNSLVALQNMLSNVARPNSLTATASNSSQIDLSWIKNASGDNVLLVWSADGTFGTPTNGTSYSAGSFISGGGEVLYSGGVSTSYNHTGLDANTTYYYRAFSYDGSTEYSVGLDVNATTDCGITSLPLNESFEGGVVPPQCWSSIDNDGDGHNWFVSGEGHNPYEGSYAAVSASYDNDEGVLTPDNWLVSPQIDVNSDDVELKYWIKAQSADWAEEYYSVLISTNSNSVGDFSVLFSETLSSDVWKEVSVPIAGYSGQNIYVAFRHSDCTDQFQIVLDKISITASVDLEPDNYPIAFNATAASSSQIDLSWTDATGTDLPDGYLIIANDDNSFSAPTDTNDPATDSDLSDGSAVVKVAHGSKGSTSFAGLTAETTYYFKIWPYANSGSDIDFKTDGTVPTGNATTEAASATETIAYQDFGADGGDWLYTPSPTTYNSSGDVWAVVSSLGTLSTMPSLNSNFWGMQDLDCTGIISSGEEATLTFNQVDVSTYSSVVLTFDYEVDGFDGGDYLEYEVTYDGAGQGVVSIANASTVDGTITLNVPGGTNTIDLIIAAYQNGGSDYAGVDNFKIVGESAGSTPTLTVNPSTLTGFTYVEGAGASTAQSFTISGSDLDGTNVTLTASTNYEISESNFAATSPITLTTFDGSETTIYVRLKSGLSAGTFNGEIISISGGGDIDGASVTCSGEVTAAPDPEPDNHVTSFTATAASSSQIDLSWTDAVAGTQVPAGYLIKANTMGTFSDPVDGTDPSEDTDLSDGAAVVKVAHGAKGSHSFAGLAAETTYYFKVWSYTNFGSDINFKTDGTVPNDNVATDAGGGGVCTAETFDNCTVGSGYADGSFTGDNGFVWSYYESRDENNDANGAGIDGNALMLRRSSDNSKIVSASVAGGIGDFSVNLYKGFTGSGSRQVELFVNGDSKGTSTVFDDNSEHEFTVSGINISGDVIVEIRNITSKQVIIDNIEWTCYGGSTPTITLSTSSLTGFTYEVAEGPSAEQSFTVEGSDLTDDITLTPPTNYEISTGTGGAFSASNPITLSPSSGSVSSTTIYVRLKAGLSQGDYNSEDITAASTDATSQTVTCSGEVTAAPDPEPTNQPTDFTATANGSSQIDLSWIDAATGTQAPAAYLIKASTSTPLTAPGDASDPAVDTDLSNGSAIVKVVHGGAASLSFTGLSASTQYYFQIWSYTNSGDDINYNLTSAPTANATTDAPPVSEFIAYQGFEADPATPVDTWTYSGGTTTESTERFYSGSRSCRIGGSSTVAFSNVDISGCDNVTLSVAFSAIGCDSDEDLFLDISYDNESSWSGTGSVKLVDGYSNANIAFGATNGSNPTTVATNPWQVAINNSETQIAIRFRTIGLDASEYYYIDEIKLEGDAISTNDTDSEVDGPLLGTQPDPVLLSSLFDTEGEAIQVFDFDVYDYGTTDGLATKITQVTIKAGGNNDVDWSTAIQGVKLSTDAGSTFVTIGSPTINASNIVIPIASGNLDIADTDAETVSLFVWLASSGLTDNGTLEFEITAAAHGFTTDAAGSSFAASFSGNTISKEMLIDVEATELQFAQQPTNTAINVNMNPSPTVKASDVNGNIDKDYVTAITISSTGTMTGDPLTGSLSNGVATFTVEHTVLGSNLTLTASSGALADEVSNMFDITELAYCTDLMISEYMEGSGNNTAIELFNGTGGVIDLSQYALKQDNAHDGDWDHTLLLSGTILHGEIYLIADKDGSELIAALALAGISIDMLVDKTENSTLLISGDDPIGLFKDDGAKSLVLLDLVGDGTNYQEVNLKRKPDVFAPNAIFTPSEWTETANTYDDLGHTDNPLPVTWSDVSAKVANGSVLVEWSTYSEINNDYFEVEHSLDNENYNAIGRVEGSGISNIFQEYSFTHRNPLLGVNYYRIKQVDFDGTSDHSKVVAAFWGSDMENALRIEYIFADATQQTAVICYLPERQFDVEIFDISGNLIYTTQQTADGYFTTIDFSNAALKQGMYIITVRGLSETAQQKFILR